MSMAIINLYTQFHEHLYIVSVKSAVFGVYLKPYYMTDHGNSPVARSRSSDSRHRKPDSRMHFAGSAVQTSNADKRKVQYIASAADRRRRIDRSAAVVKICVDIRKNSMERTKEC